MFIFLISVFCVLEIRHLFCSEENDWGFTTFCYWDYICDPRNKYILNDSVKFDVSHCDKESQHLSFFIRLLQT